MKFLKLILFGLMLLFSTSQIMANELIFSNPDKPIIVSKTAASFIIRLKSNPTTGYGWFLTACNSELVTPMSVRYVPPEKAIPGAGGYDEWTFIVTRLGFIVRQIMTIELTYARPWDLTDGNKVKFKIVTIDK